MTTDIPAPYKHQQESVEFYRKTPRALNTSGCGTGKTRAILDWYAEDLEAHGRMLVLAPLSILEPAWGEDIKKWQPQLSYTVAYAKNRREAFRSTANIVITNHDAVRWILDNDELLYEFNTLVVDEFTAFKQRTSQRSKALCGLRGDFKYVRMLSGTPNPNTICDIWHPAYICDDGKRLGASFYQFQQSVCTPEIIKANVTRWRDRPESIDIVADLLKDITIRYQLEDCIDMPTNITRTVYYEPSARIMSKYRELEKESALFLDQNVITAPHAGAVTQKLLQLLSGSVYDNNGDPVLVSGERYNIVLDLIKETSACVVAFNWSHEKNRLVKLAEKEKITYGVIDGSVPTKMRNKTVEDFQNGKIQVIFAHPASAGHGLTLTRGERTIWASATYNAEHYAQFNHRIYRAGQTKRTETIHVTARNTYEEHVYKLLGDKMDSMETLLDYFKQLQEC